VFSAKVVFDVFFNVVVQRCRTTISWFAVPLTPLVQEGVATVFGRRGASSIGIVRDSFVVEDIISIDIRWINVVVKFLGVDHYP
jgi:hypothetical protein